MTTLQQLLHRPTQFLHRQTWVILLVIAAVFMLVPSFARAQNTVCSSQTVSDPEWPDTIEQTVCITPGVSGTVETDNNSYDGNLDDLTVYGVAAEGVVTDYFGDVLADSGMQYGDTSATGGSSEVVEVPFQGEAYTLTGLADDCTFPANTFSYDYNFQALCWDNTFPGASVSMQQVSTVPTTLALTASTLTATAGQPVTFTATLNTSGAIGEQMMFDYAYLMPNGYDFGYGGDYVTLSGGAPGTSVATFTANMPVTFVNNPQVAIYAVYPGDQTYSEATSNSLTEVPPSPTVSTIIGSSLNPSINGQLVLLTASVTSQGGPAPTGTVTFLDVNTGIAIASGQLNASGIVSVSTSSLSVGSHAITANYSGDSLNQGSTSQPMSQTVQSGSGSSAQPAVVASSGSNQVSAGSTIYITSAPAMPPLSVQIPGLTNCNNVSYSLQIKYTGQDGTQTAHTFNSNGSIPGDKVWTLNWSNFIEGGTATLTWIVDTQQSQSITFTILGTDPSTSAVQSAIAALPSLPWFFSSSVNWESGAYRNGTVQFDLSGSQPHTGNPLFGGPHGYGMTQMDPLDSLSIDAEMWNWRANLEAGESRENSYQQAAYAHWVDVMVRYAQDSGPKPSVPTVSPGNGKGGCYFQNQATGSSHPYADVDWIHRYNGGYYFYYQISTKSSPGYWNLEAQTNVSQQGYVQNVCNTPPW